MVRLFASPWQINRPAVARTEVPSNRQQYREPSARAFMWISSTRGRFAGAFSTTTRRIQICKADAKSACDRSQQQRLRRQLPDQPCRARPRCCADSHFPPQLSFHRTALETARCTVFLPLCSGICVYTRRRGRSREPFARNGRKANPWWPTRKSG